MGVWSVSQAVLLVEDDSRVARAFARMLAGLDVEIVIVGRADAALAALATRAFAAVVLDLGLPDRCGMYVLEQMHPGPSVLVLTAADDRGLGLVCLARGARFAEKCGDDGITQRGLRAHVLGGIARSAGTEDAKRAVAMELVEPHGLSAREAEVAVLRALGFRAAEIATKLGLSENTVTNELTRGLEKIPHLRGGQRGVAFELEVLEEALLRAVEANLRAHPRAAT